MSWACYKIHLKAKAPIHIGYGAELGMFSRTRYHIPAKNIWGSLTNLITKNIMKNYNPEIYQEVGKFINQNFKFSYFYPVEYERADGEMRVQQVFAPNYEEKKLKFGVCKSEEKSSISLEEFERIFISSSASTGIDKGSKSAEEGSLHEIEFIREKINCNTEVKSTVFVGYFFVRDISPKTKIGRGEIEISFTDVIEVNGVKLKEMWIGGEKSYGFGKVETNLEKVEGREINLFDSGMLVDIDRNTPSIYCKNEHEIALSHISFENLDIKLVRGDVEPLVGREWSEIGSGQKISENVRICISPGSQFICDANIVIGNFGIWEALK